MEGEGVIMDGLDKIAIIGGTGRAGKLLVREALDRGFNIRMLVRNPQKLEFSNDRVEVIKGDARDLGCINTLLEDCKCVISTLGQPKGEKPIFSTATGNILASMKDKGIYRYIVVTGTTAVRVKSDRKNISGIITAKMMKVVFPAIMTDRQKEYETLLESDIDWTLLRLPLIVNQPLNEEIKVKMECSPGKKIYAGALASYLLDQITDRNYIRKAPFIAS